VSSRDDIRAADAAMQAERILPSPSEPMAVARTFHAERYQHADGSLLRHWRGQWWEWKVSHWSEIELGALRAGVYRFTEHAFYRDAEGKPRPWAPNRNRVLNVLEALAGIVLLPKDVDQPTWITGGHEGVIVACANGLLDVSTRILLEHTPAYFNQTAVPFDYDADALDPTRWEEFLADLWGDDVESIATLAQWFGYVLSGRLDLHKIFLLVGPTRAGKGVIARVLGALIGHANVAGPTLSSLNGDFGLAPLIGKPLAVIADARLNGRGDTSAVVERLLSISGEDMLSVNIKYREQWTGKLPSRFMVLSNELPRLGDASAAIAGRFVTLLLHRSWLNEEDPDLEPDLHHELPGILNWALDGLADLVEQTRFTRPEATQIAFTALQDLASPVGAFVREACVTGSEHEITIDRLWKAWKFWGEEGGHRAGTKQKFGADLRAVYPRLKRRRPRDKEDDEKERPRYYEGVALRPDWETDWMAATGQVEQS
jgi:putative DNA primase/helicase